MHCNVRCSAHHIRRAACVTICNNPSRHVFEGRQLPGNAVWSWKLSNLPTFRLACGLGWCREDMDEESLKLNWSKFIFGLSFPNCMINSLHVKLLGFELQGNDNWTLFIQQILAKSLLWPKTCRFYRRLAHEECTPYNPLSHLRTEELRVSVHLAIVEKSCQPSTGIRGTILGRL